MVDAQTVDSNYAARNKIASLRQDAEDLERNWLRVNGWSMTSSTPGSFWMYEKIIDGVTYRMMQDMAAALQSVDTVRAYYQAHPELEAD